MSTPNFLILGSGIAGLAAALTAAERGTVLIVTKNRLASGSSFFAQGGIAAARDPQWDSPAAHAADTLTAGCGLNRKSAVKMLTEAAPAAVDWLARLGVPFAPEPTREAAHSVSRVWHTGDATGQAIETVLAAAVRKNQNIRVQTGTELLDLIVKDGRCHGAVLRRGAELYAQPAGATVLATGGYGALFARTTNPPASAGDGLAAAIRAGAAVSDLEFVQFHPTALVGKKRQLTLLSETLRGEGAVLRNSRGERFLPRYHPAAELAPRDIVARAIFAELAAGPVFLDFTRAKPEFLRSRFPAISRAVAAAGFDLAHDLLPIFPVAHYSCGGVTVDLRGQTNIKNLFAAGEVAGSGVHGANRLASNSLAEAMVWGRAVGAAAPVLAGALPRHFRVAKYAFDPAADRRVRRLVGQILWEKVGIVRTTAGLAAAAAELSKLKPQSHAARNAVTVATAIVAAARARRRSVGTHFLAG